MRRLVVSVPVIVGLVLPLGSVTPVAAHCAPEGANATTCQLNDELEVAVAALNAASDGTVAYVLVKDFGFHPPVVTVKSGGTVLFAYADQEWAQQHNPLGSGPCSDATVDPLTNPEACTPTRPGICFNQAADQGRFMKALGDTYPVTFRYTPAKSLLQKSKGILSGTAVGDLTGAEPFKNCPGDASIESPTEAVLPYHCGIHGGALTAIKVMRGTIIVKA